MVTACDLHVLPLLTCPAHSTTTSHLKSYHNISVVLIRVSNIQNLKLEPPPQDFLRFQIQMTRSQLFSTSTLPTLLLLLCSILLLSQPTHAIKFILPAYRYPQPKCIWNAAHTNTLAIVTANVAPGPNQRVDIEIVDSSAKHNVYLAKKGINGEARLAITTHSEGEVGVCFKNHIEGGTFAIYHLP